MSENQPSWPFPGKEVPRGGGGLAGLTGDGAAELWTVDAISYSIQLGVSLFLFFFNSLKPDL